MQLKFHTLDVFTERRFSGNPLAVVLGGDGLDGPAMQAVAREFNLSETVFVLKPENPAHSARVRIFTPTSELPFAGHPTVGTAVLLASLKGAAEGGNRDAIIALEQKLGVVRVGVRFRADKAAFAEFDAPRLPEEAGSAASAERIAAALGLIPSEIGFQNHRPTRFSAGVAFTFVPISGLEAIAKAQPRGDAWAAAFGSEGHNAAYIYTRQTAHTAAHFHARMFAPSMGLVEDPATGSAAVAFAGAITRFDALLSGNHKRMIEQGYEMGRPSEILLGMEVEGGALTAVRIGGHAVPVSEGMIEI